MLTLSLPFFLLRARPEFAVNDGLKNLYMGDSWFTSLTMAQALRQQGQEVIGRVRQNHGGYPRDFISQHLKDAPGGVHIVLKGTLPSGEEMVATGYRYSSKEVLHFLLTAGARLTTPGEPYEMKYTDR